MEGGGRLEEKLCFLPNSRHRGAHAQKDPVFGWWLCCLEILNNFEQRNLYLHFAPGLTNYVADAECSDKIRVIPEEQVGLVFGGDISLSRFNFSRCYKKKASQGKQWASASYLGALGEMHHWTFTETRCYPIFKCQNISHFWKSNAATNLSLTLSRLWPVSTTFIILAMKSCWCWLKKIYMHNVRVVS